MSDNVFVVVDPRAIIVASLMMFGAGVIYIYAIHVAIPHQVHADGIGEKRMNSVIEAALDPAAMWQKKRTWRICLGMVYDWEIPMSRRSPLSHF